MKQKRRFAALLAAAALAVNLAAIPVLATETTEPVSPLTGAIQPDPPEEELPNPDPPVEDQPSSSTPQEPSAPSEAPVEEPSSTPSHNSSSSSSPENSSSEDPWVSEGEDPTSQEPEDSSSSWEEPSQEPSDTVNQWESEESSQQETVQAPSYEEPEAIATPRPAMERPSVSLHTGSSSSQTEEETGPNYVTFATLNVRGNSMATTLFYSGVGFIALGVLGLVTVLVLYIHSRRRYAGAEEILEEIHQAEVRQQPGQGQVTASQEIPRPTAPVVPPTPAAPGYGTPSDALMPEEASLYTEEFALPPQDQAYGPYEDEAYREEDYGESYGQYQGQVAQEYSQDVYYDSGDYYDDYEDYGPYPEESYQDPGAPQESYQETGYQDGYGSSSPSVSYGEQPPVSRPVVPQDQEATRQFDTEEILREALRYTDEDYQEDNYDSYH